MSDWNCAQTLAPKLERFISFCTFSPFCGLTLDKGLIAAHARRTARTRDVKRTRNGCVVGFNNKLSVNFRCKQTIAQVETITESFKSRPQLQTCSIHVWQLALSKKIRGGGVGMPARRHVYRALFIDEKSELGPNEDTNELTQWQERFGFHVWPGRLAHASWGDRLGEFLPRARGELSRSPFRLPAPRTSSSPTR